MSYYAIRFREGDAVAAPSGALNDKARHGSIVIPAENEAAARKLAPTLVHHSNAPNRHILDVVLAS